MLKTAVCSDSKWGNLLYVLLYKRILDLNHIPKKTRGAVIREPHQRAWGEDAYDCKRIGEFFNPDWPKN